TIDTSCFMNFTNTSPADSHVTCVMTTLSCYKQPRTCMGQRLRSSANRNHELLNWHRARRMVALARYFYAVASRFATRVATEPLPNWYAAETSNVRAHVCLLIDIRRFCLSQLHVPPPTIERCMLK